MFIPCSASLAGNVVTTLGQSSFNDGMERVMLAAAGNHQAEFVALMRQLARGTISTRKVTALTAVTTAASSIIFRQVDQGGTGNSTYVSLAGGAKTIAVPRRISWNAGGPATLDAELMFLSADGTTAPITVAAVAGTLTAEADVWVGSGTGIFMISIDFGFELNVPPDGHLYPVNAFVISQRPVISIGYHSEALITQANIQPGAIASLTATLAKIASGGVRGATTNYSVTGHQHIQSVDGSKPGRVIVTCAGTGGLTIT